ncbi:MAG: hypothetical protein MRY63_03175 [Neomegalonema sp.]|nr:hypothetical protein [Neomegalonema sp.]
MMKSIILLIVAFGLLVGCSGRRFQSKEDGSPQLQVYYLKPRPNANILRATQDYQERILGDAQACWTGPNGIEPDLIVIGDGEWSERDFDGKPGKERIVDLAHKSDPTRPQVRFTIVSVPGKVATFAGIYYGEYGEKLHEHVKRRVKGSWKSLCE